MKKILLNILVLMVFVSAAYAGATGSSGDSEPGQAEIKKAYEPAGKFIPTEKLRADDTVDFPVDI